MINVKQLLIPLTIVLVACTSCSILGQEKACEADNTGKVTYLNDTGDDVIISAMIDGSFCGGSGPNYPPGAKYTLTGTPGESYVFCATLFSHERTEKVSGTYPSQCEEESYTWN